MKRTFYLHIITIFFFASSCRSVDKMVEKGDYDQAIEYASSKLIGEKKKKTKYVKALERAYTKLTEEDFSRLAFLERKGDPASWIERYNILGQVERRQESIRPLLPLTSEDGYRARFELIDTAPLIDEAGEGAAAWHYGVAIKALGRARTGDMREAKDAYAELQKINRYKSEYRDQRSLMEEAHELGTKDVMLIVDEELLRALDLRVWDAERYLRDIQDKFWIRYHTRQVSGQKYDQQIILQHGDVYSTPEREHVDRYNNTVTNEKEVNRKDAAGNTVRDSTGTVIKDKITETFEASIVDVTRTKGLKLICEALLLDKDGRVLTDKELEVVLDFESKAFTYSGDREALPSTILPRVDLTLEPFPTDWEMAKDAMLQMSELFRDFVDDCQ